MTISEQQEQSKLQPYAEALRYMSNAEETLQKAIKEDGYYKDRKYVRSACGIAYLGVLEALEKWLELKDVPDPKKQRKTILFYQNNVAKWDKKLSIELHVAYEILHREGYYDGIQKVSIVREGFDSAYEIISRIKPAVPEEELQAYLTAYQEQKTSLWKRMYMMLWSVI
ncbi:hypothetical protein FACS189452_03510 [Bacteroidia bacterium]|nr:hypothetical protein FACS189452_03510 [Bacteroidia bacterium]